MTRALALRPEINEGEIRANGTPTQVQIGAFFGYSMPIWADPAQLHEELYFKQVVPGRWDGVSDAEVHIFCCLSQAEDVGDYFKFQLSWESVVPGDVVPATTHDVTAEQIVLAGRADQYDLYRLAFVMDVDGEGVGMHDLLATRLRRVDATNPDVTGEIIVLCWHDHWHVDKMFTS